MDVNHLRTRHAGSPLSEHAGLLLVLYSVAISRLGPTVAGERFTTSGREGWSRKRGIPPSSKDKDGSLPSSPDLDVVGTMFI